MKKQIIKNILIIVLGVFIIIPLISMIFNIDFSRQEGFTDNTIKINSDMAGGDFVGIDDGTPSDTIVGYLSKVDGTGWDLVLGSSSNDFSLNDKLL